MSPSPVNLSHVDISVRYAETDAMRVVYYANYLVYFEVARTTALAELGHPYATMEAEGFMIPVLEVQCRFFKPARYGDTLRIETCRWRLGSAKIQFDYQVFRDRELLAVGSTQHAFINADGKPVKPPRTILSLFPAHSSLNDAHPNDPSNANPDAELGEAFEGRR